MKLGPDLMKMFGLGGGLQQGASAMDRLNRLNKLAGGLDAAVNSEGVFGKFQGLLGILGGVGKGASKNEANPKPSKFEEKYEQLNRSRRGDTMKIAHHRDKNLKPLKNFQHRNLGTYDAMREGGMMNKADYEKNLKRHKIPKEHWYGGLG